MYYIEYLGKDRHDNEKDVYVSKDGFLTNKEEDRLEAGINIVRTLIGEWGSNYVYREVQKEIGED